MSGKWNKIICSAVLYAALAMVVFLISKMQRSGVISIGEGLFIIAWIGFAILGIAGLILRRLEILNKSQVAFIFLGVANLCNAICGAYILFSHDSGTTNMTLVWFQLGLTACIAFLIFTDILL